MLKKVGNQAELFLRHFLEHAKQEKHANKYKSGLIFLKKFRFSLYKAEANTFLISLTTNYSKNPISVSVSTNINGRQTPIYSANLKFSKGKVIIETLQGTPWLKEIREFERAVNLPASRHLVREITNHAKKMGFEKVLLIDPTAHPSYSNPHLQALYDKKTRELHMKIALGESTKAEREEYKRRKKEFIALHQNRMSKLYHNVAQGEGFVKEENILLKP